MPTDEQRAKRWSPRTRPVVITALAIGGLTILAVNFLNLRSSPWQRSATLVGDQSCVACHENQAATYPQTAHAQTSDRATGDAVHGKFGPGDDLFRTGDPDLHFRMEMRGSEYFQTAVIKTSATEVLTRTERMDIVIGSGRKGQTYLYWDDNQLLQLPVSYWAEHGVWVNSPGFIDGKANFERPIIPRCLECHASSFVSRAPPENAYEKASLVLGISCEKCHGPGSVHVARYRSAKPPKSLADAAIVNPARLSRDRQTDLCSLCHAGLGKAHTAPLSFRPGDTLAKHLTFPPQPPGAHIDVHASQVQLMERSRCFRASAAMTCTTCHDVHRPQRDLAEMAARCLQCHKVEQCGTFPAKGQQIVTQCVTCHMPLEQTAQIVIADGVGRTMQPKVRNHQIAIYPEVTPDAAP